MKIDLHYRSNDIGQVQVYKRVRPALSAIGIDLRMHNDTPPSPASDADVFVIQQFYATSDILKRFTGRNVVIEERVDCAMPWTRAALEFDCVKQLRKVGVVSKPWINRSTPRVHVSMLTGEFDSPRQLLTDEQIAKCVPGISFGMYDRMAIWQDARELRDWEDRPIDVSFAGNVGGYDKAICEHRTRLVELLDQSKWKTITHSGRPLSQNDYAALLTKTKIVVSPWGNGELCYRDYEALYAGCLLVKPDTDFVSCKPNIMKSREYYLPCLMDWQDLGTVIDGALENPLNHEDIRRRGRDKLTHWYKPMVIAKWLKSEFECL